MVVVGRGGGGEGGHINQTDGSNITKFLSIRLFLMDDTHASLPPPHPSTPTPPPPTRPPPSVHHPPTQYVAYTRTIQLSF